MQNKKAPTYLDTLLKHEQFRKAFEKEYSKLLISEQITRVRKSAHLTQAELAKKIRTTKSAISRYESAHYRGYSITLLQRIAHACGAHLHISFIDTHKLQKPSKSLLVKKMQDADYRRRHAKHYELFKQEVTARNAIEKHHSLGGIRKK